MTLRLYEAVAAAAVGAVSVFHSLCFAIHSVDMKGTKTDYSPPRVSRCAMHTAVRIQVNSMLYVSPSCTHGLSQHRQKANNNIRLNKFIVRCCSPPCSRAAHSTHAHTSIFLENTDLSKPRWGRQALLVWLVCACNDLFRAHAENKATTATVRLCNQ